MATSEKLTLFNNLLTAYKSAYPKKTGDVIQNEVSDLWSDMKKLNSDMTSLKDACARKIVELKTMTAKRKCTLLDMWSNASKKSKDSCSSDRHDTVGDITMPECVTVAEPNFSVTEGESTSTITTTRKTIKEIVSPKQKQLKGKIEEQNELLVSLYKKRSLDQLSENDRKEFRTRRYPQGLQKGVEKMRA